MNVEPLQEWLNPEWERFVAGHEHATFFHQLGWKQAVEHGYGLRSHYLLARNRNGVFGVLPLFEVHHLRQGKGLVSVPFASVAGVCATTAEAQQALLHRAVELARKTGARYLELRQLNERLENLDCNEQYVTSLLKLDADPEKVWKGFRSEIRNRVRKAEKSGLEVEQGGAEFLPDFYRVYRTHMRELGTPAHPLRFLQEVLQAFPEATRLFLVKLDGETVGGMFVLLHRNVAINMWASCLTAYGKLSPNNLLYWHAIKFAAERGFEWFDFGRSVRDSGPFVFKKRWGTEHRPLYYHYFLNKIARVPEAPGTNAGENWFANVWKRLPQPVTNHLGPVIRKHIP